MKTAKLFVFLITAMSCACAAGELASKSTNVSNVEPATYNNSPIASNPSAQAVTNTAAGSISETAEVTKRADRKRSGRPQQVNQKNVSLDQTARDIQSLTDRKIVRNAEINLEAESPEAAQQKITTIAEMKGGFVVESQQSSSNLKSATRDIVTMAVRVPSARFADALEEIRGTGDRVLIETVKGEDVTEEFIDIEARLKAKKSLEAQFMEIMKRANSVGDALDVQSQLADVRGEIEVIEGRKRFLENQASMSTIRIRLQAPTVIAASSSDFVPRLTDSFSTGLDFAINFLLGLLTFVIAVLPFALLIGLPAFLIIRYGWKRHIRPRSVSEIAKDEISG